MAVLYRGIEALRRARIVLTGVEERAAAAWKDNAHAKVTAEFLVPLAEEHQRVVRAVDRFEERLTDVRSLLDR
jgi:hypothetical protein